MFLLEDSCILHEAIRMMKEEDAAIDVHGGWPLK